MLTAAHKCCAPVDCSPDGGADRLCGRHPGRSVTGGGVRMRWWPVGPTAAIGGADSDGRWIRR